VNLPLTTPTDHFEKFNAVLGLVVFVICVAAVLSFAQRIFARTAESGHRAAMSAALKTTAAQISMKLETLTTKDSALRKLLTSTRDSLLVEGYREKVHSDAYAYEKVTVDREFYAWLFGFGVLGTIGAIRTLVSGNKWRMQQQLLDREQAARTASAELALISSLKTLDATLKIRHSSLESLIPSTLREPTRPEYEHNWITRLLYSATT
jgi:hypothetical protein